MAVTNDEIQSRNRQLQNDLTGAQAQRANLTALRTASKPIGYSSAGGYGSAAPTYRTPIDRINYETAAIGMAQNDATMQGITKRAGVLTNDANNFTAQQVAARYGVRPQLAPSGGDPRFADVQHGVVSSYDQPKIAASSPAATPPLRVIPTGVNRTINLGASGVYGGGGAVRSTLASSIDKNGVPTYDNNSIQRMLDRDGQAAVTGDAAPAAATVPAFATSAPSSQAVGAVLKSPEELDRPRRVISDLDSAIFRQSLNPNSRSKREMLSQLIATKQGYITDQSALQAGSEQAARAQQGETQRALISQAGEDRRSTGQINAQLQLEGIRQAGENSRHASTLRRPLTIGDMVGTIGDDGVFRAVRDQNGKEVALPQKAIASGGLDPNDTLKSIDGEYRTLLESYPSASAARQAEMQQRMGFLQSQRDQIRGLSPVKPTQAEVIARGKDLIARGQMTREEAKKRLEAAGYSADGL